ncbi:AMP-binding protein, partial [Mycobacterium sp. GA-1285]|uniref:AMP-binding protein n=1 Tax=Mycobacterium sp. GA-1285 TaxID=1772282 RepID=UPI000B24C9D5
FDVAGVEVLVQRLQRVLVAMTVDPLRLVSSVDLLDAGEHAWLDRVGHRAVLEQPVGASVSIPELFAVQVGRVPEAVAVSFEGRSLTYRELDEASNRLAHLLVGYGAGPGERVALLVERSAEAIVALLAVLKTGAAYLAVDPAHPDTRLQFMVADAAPVVVVCSAGLRSRLDGLDVAVVDVADRRTGSAPATALPAPAGADIAYLIYTSGTTGVPKGVAVAHRNVIRLLEVLDAGMALAGQVWS